jgi:hypothetical protein
MGLSKYIGQEGREEGRNKGIVYVRKYIRVHHGE